MVSVKRDVLDDDSSIFKTRVTYVTSWVSPIPNSTVIDLVIDKNENGSDVTQDVDVLVWWRDVGDQYN
jgi:hypothetical protein